MFKNLLKKSIPLLMLLLVIFSLSGPIFATETTAGGNTLQVKNPLGDEINTPQKAVGIIIKAALGLTGTIALIYFIIGGFTWMTAGGNKDKVTKGRDTLVWAAIGLFIIFSAYSILTFVFDIIPTN